MKRLLMILAALSLATIACDEGNQPASPQDAPASSAAADAMSDADLEKADIPVVADFEQEATETITSDTLDAQVAALEKEIASDPGG